MLLLSFGKQTKLCDDMFKCGYPSRFFLFQLDMLYEGYKRTELKENPKAHLLMEWLKNNIPKDEKKAGMKRFTTTLV